jgi:Zn-dependent metalloprotease
MSDLQLCGAKQLRKHEVGFIANKNLFFRETRKTYKFLCGKNRRNDEGMERLSFRILAVLALSFIAPTLMGLNVGGQAQVNARSSVEHYSHNPTISWNEAIGTPSLMTGALSKPSKHSSGWIAYEFVTAHKKLYGLRNPKQDLKIINTTKSDSGKAIITFQHFLFGTPVWGDVLTITIDSSGVIRRAEGTIHPNLEKRLFHRAHHAAVTPRKALSIAMKQSLPANCSFKPEVQAYYYPRQSGVPLVYAVSLCANDPHNQSHTLIHSLSGRIIAQPSE